MENRFIRAEDVAQELNVSKPYAYKLIRQLNEELKAKGFITVSYTHLDVYKRQVGCFRWQAEETSDEMFFAESKY